MSNEPLGIVEERQRNRALWGEYEYQAPKLASEAAKNAIEKVLNTSLMKKHIKNVVEKAVMDAINASEESKKWRDAQIARMAAKVFIAFDDILRVVTDVTGVSHEEMCGTRRMRSIAWPRFLACGLIFRLRPDLSYPAIARALGNKDHTTIMHAVRRFNAMKEEEPFKGWLADPRIVALADPQ